MSQEKKVKTTNLDPLPMCAEHGCLHVHYIYNIQFILQECFQRTIAITLRITIEIHLADSAMCLSKHLICKHQRFQTTQRGRLHFSHRTYECTQTPRAPGDVAVSGRAEQGFDPKPPESVLFTGYVK